MFKLPKMKDRVTVLKLPNINYLLLDPLCLGQKCNLPGMRWLAQHPQTRALVHTLVNPIFLPSLFPSSFLHP